MGRIRGLVLKDVAELWRNPGAILPAISMALAALVPAFLVAVVAPLVSGETLGESERVRRRGACGRSRRFPSWPHLDGNALVQAFLFHQFGLLLLMVPIVGSMALAAHAVIGEKTSRTLEPLLATPISTVELLAAKAMTPFAFALLVMWVTLLLYIGGIASIGEPGVWHTFCGAAVGAALLRLLGPLLTLVALLLAVIVSSRVNDPRSAQQLGALVVMPVTGAFVAQLVGQFICWARKRCSAPRWRWPILIRRAACGSASASSTGSAF